MGFLTTVTIYNDSADQLTNHSKELAEKLEQACSGIQINTGRDYDSLGNTDILILQKPRHANDHTLYMHAGNTVIDVYNAKTEWAVNQFITEMEYHLKRLKDIKQNEKFRKTGSITGQRISK